MPRGVPNSGVRRTRAVLAAEEGQAEPGQAPDADFDDDTEPPAEQQAAPAETAGDAADLVEPAEPVLSADQATIKALRDQLAQLSGRKDVLPEPAELSAPGDSANILIHFLEDGLTGLGRMFYRGDELEFEPGSQSYKDTCDRNGRSWLELRGNDFGQVERYGKVMFRVGPWPGKTYADGKFEVLRAEKGDAMVAPPTADELAAAEKQRQRRAAPRLPALV